MLSSMNISRDPASDASNAITEHEITPSTSGVKTSMTKEHASDSLARGGSTSRKNYAELDSKLNGHKEDLSSNDQTVIGINTNNMLSYNQSMMDSSVRRKTDPAWEHFSFKKEGRSNVFTCLYCSNVYRGGGINRMKQHLAGVFGQITSCQKVPRDVRQKMKESLKDAPRKNKLDEIHEHYGDEEGCEVVDVDPCPTPIRMVTPQNCGKRKALEAGSNCFTQRTTPSFQPSIKSFFSSKEAEDKAKMALAEWCIINCIPSSAIDCPFFRKAMDAIAASGPGFKAPTAYDVRVNLLPDLKRECQLLIEAHRSRWETNGCTLMVDGWTDSRQRVLINFLVYSTKGMVFVKSLDASDLVKDAKAMFSSFCEVIEWIGPKNIVHAVADNSANYVACGKLIHDKYKHIYWSSCATHCLNLILKDIASMPHVSDLVSRVSKITMFVYNHATFLSWLRKREGWGEIVLPGATEFSTPFITLRSIYEHKLDLQALVVDKHFANNKLSKTAVGKVFHAILLDNKFWNDCYDIVMLVGPLIRLLRIVDADEKPSLGYVYGGMLRAKNAIKNMFNKNKDKYKPYTNLIKAQWDRHLKTGLHAVAYHLNPVFMYDDEFCHKGKIMDAVLDLFKANNSSYNVNMIEQLCLYRNRDGCFARDQCSKAAKGLPPHEWWTYFGDDVLELQQLAVRILSQTLSSSGCERNSKLFERLHAKGRNKLSHQSLNDLVFTNYKMRLQHRSQLKKKTYDPIDYESIDKIEFWIAKDSSPEFDDADCDELMREETVLPPPPPDRHFEGDEDMNIPEPPPLLDDFGC